MLDRSDPHLQDEARGTVTQRNLGWSMFFTRLLAQNEQLRNDLPEDVPVVLLPKGDEELVRHNLELFETKKEEGDVVLLDISLHDSAVDVRLMGTEGRRRYAVA